MVETRNESRPVVPCAGHWRVGLLGSSRDACQKNHRRGTTVPLLVDHQTPPARTPRTVPQTLQLAAARMGLVACSAPPPACQLPPALRARRFVMLMPLGIRENPGALYLSLEPPKCAIQAFVLANTDLSHPPPPPRHPGPAMTTWGTSDPPVGMNETSVIILRRGGEVQSGSEGSSQQRFSRSSPFVPLPPREGNLLGRCRAFT